MPQTAGPQGPPPQGAAPQSAAPGKKPGPVFFRRADFWVVAALLLCGGVWLAVSLLSRPAGVAQVSVTHGSTAESFEVPLGRDDVIEVQGALPVTLEVKDGAVRFVNAQCPDHTCEGFGWISRDGEWALCAPAGVMVSVRED